MLAKLLWRSVVLDTVKWLRVSQKEFQCDVKMEAICLRCDEIKYQIPNLRKKIYLMSSLLKQRISRFAVFRKIVIPLPASPHD